MGIIVYKRAILLFRTGQRGGAANSHGMGRAYGSLGSCEPLTGALAGTGMGGGFETITDWHIGL